MAGVKHAFFTAFFKVCLQVGKPSFISSDNFYVKHYNKDSSQVGRTFIFPGLWQSVGSRLKFAVR